MALIKNKNITVQYCNQIQMGSKLFRVGYKNIILLRFWNNWQENNPNHISMKNSTNTLYNCYVPKNINIIIYY